MVIIMGGIGLLIFMLSYVNVIMILFIDFVVLNLVVKVLVMFEELYLIIGVKFLFF